MNSNANLSKKLKALGLALALGATSGAQAAVIGVGELGDLRSSAFNLNPFFDLSADPNIFESTTTLHATAIAGIRDSVDVDWFSFTATAGARIFLDIDENPFVVDTTLGLFDANGTQLGENDDSISDPGSASGLDSFLGVIIAPTTGTYFVGVSSFARFPSASCTGSANLTRPDGQFGGTGLSGCTVGDDSYAGTGVLIGQPGPYTLHVSVSNLPEPASLAMAGLALLGACAARRRARA